MPTRRNGWRSPSGIGRQPGGSSRSGNAETAQPPKFAEAADPPHGPAPGTEDNEADALGKGKSRLMSAAKLGAAGAAGGGVAGTLVAWGGVGVAAAGGAIGLPVIVPVAIGAAAGVGVIAAAKRLKGPVTRASSALRSKYGDEAGDDTEETAPEDTEACSVPDSEMKGGARSGAAQATAAAAARAAAAALAGTSVIPKLRRRVFKNADSSQTRVPPHARRYLYVELPRFCGQFAILFIHRVACCYQQGGWGLLS